MEFKKTKIRIQEDLTSTLLKTGEEQVGEQRASKGLGVDDGEGLGETLVSSKACHLSSAG